MGILRRIRQKVQNLFVAKNEIGWDFKFDCASKFDF